MPFFSKNKKKILTLSLVIVIAGGIFILGAPKAHAGVLSWLVGEAVAMSFGAVVYLLQSLSAVVLWIFSWFVWLAAQLLDAVFAVEDFTSTVPAIKSGWEICRGLCNMFFALALLLMAFATILRIEKYGMKEYLWKIVVAALLINFSLVIAGVFIDFAQITTHYFIEAAKGTGGTTGGTPSLSGQLMNGLGAQNTLSMYDSLAANDTGEIGKSLAKGVTGYISVLIATFFGIIIMLIAAFTLLAACVFLIVRIVVIWLLLIFSPFAWLSFALPGKAGSLWEKWWSNFLKWVFFAPIYAFFIYLVTLMIGTGSQGTIAAIFNDTQRNITDAQGYTGILSGMLKGGVGMLLQYIIIIIILLGGLFVAQSFGIYGAKGVMGIGKWMASRGTHNVSKWVAQGARMPFGEKLGGWMDKKFENNRLYMKMRTSPGLERAFNIKRRIASMTSPQVWARAWAAMTARSDNRAFSESSGDLRDLFSKGGLKKLWKNQKGRWSDFEREKVIAAEAAEINKALPDEKRKVAAVIEATEKGNKWDKEVMMRALVPTNSWNVFQEMKFGREAQRLGFEKIARAIATQKAEKLAPVVEAIKGLRSDLKAGKIDQGEFNSRLAIEKSKERTAIAEIDEVKKKAVSDIDGKTTLFDLEKKYELGGKWKDENGKETRNFHRIMKEILGKRDGARVGADIQSYQTAIGNFSNTGAYVFNEEKNEWEENTEEGQASFAVGKFNEFDVQDVMKKMHPDSYLKTRFEISEEGGTKAEISGVSKTGEAVISNFSEAALKQMDRAQPRAIQRTAENAELIRAEMEKVNKAAGDRFAERAIELRDKPAGKK